MAGVWQASGLCTDAQAAGGALTLRGESGLAGGLGSFSRRLFVFLPSLRAVRGEGVKDWGRIALGRGVVGWHPPYEDGKVLLTLVG